MKSQAELRAELEALPVTHRPHTQVVYMPGPSEIEVRISLSVCDMGKCSRSPFTGVQGGPVKFPQARIPFVQRYAATGMRAAIIPGVHWWEGSVWYFMMQTMAHLRLAEHEGRENTASHSREQLAILRPYLKTDPYADAATILGY